MDLGIQRFIYQVNNPVDHSVLDVGRDNGIFDRALLQNRNAEPLSHRTILLLLENFNNFVHDAHVLAVGQVLYTSESGTYHRNQRSYRVP